MRKVKVKTRN